ncbi:MAG: ABC transporter ATP-binding protein [Chlorobi bacterium]|nr:ABC transporter ATP-binding protein [Chlorobiota bacterium]
MLELKNINLSLGEFKLTRINLKILSGEYFALLGMSGAGKSLILEMIAGMIKPDSGHVFLNEEEITNKKIQNRNVGIIFQEAALFPNKTVKENLAFPFNKKKIAKKKIEQRVLEIAQLTDVNNLLDRMPETLSGGEKQRVAIGRILALNPQVILLDEPLSSLDAGKKNDFTALLRKINRQGITMVHVTHDYHEAVSLANRIAVIHNGQIEQTGTPKEIFHRPNSKFIADLSGIKNFYTAEIVDENTALLENVVKITLPKMEDKERGFVSFKMHDVVISLNKMQSSICNQFEGKVIDIVKLTQNIEIVVDANIKIMASITYQSFENMNLEIGKTVWIGFKATAVQFISKTVD